MERLKGEGVQDWLSQHLTAPWHGHQTVASELTNDILLNIRERWSQLDSPVRVSVLFSLISLKKAQQVELKQKCQELIDHACSDPDDWVRLIAQMLQDYPTEGTLRFNVEQFADQAQLGTQLENLEKRINSEGIKFHPKEWTYLNTSVWHPAGSKDPQEPSIHQHFVLKKKFRNNHSERSERLLKLAEKAGTFTGGSAMGAGGPLSPTLLGPGSTIHTPMAGVSAGGPVPGAGGRAAVTAAGVPGVAPGVAGQPGVPGAAVPGSGLLPPRPAKPAGGGLFVNRRPKNITLPRNPSTLPLRSPRTDGPAMPRLNQKLSRIQILDMQEGTEIIQSMKDDKLRQEQEEQRQREQKKEQRLQELEQKRQQDAEKKLQLQREKEEKQREKEERRREREDAKRERERIRSEREERIVRGDRDGASAGEIRKRGQTDDEEEDEEGAAGASAGRKKARTAAGRGRRQLASDNDQDMQDAPEHISPLQTPVPGSAQPTPMEYSQAQPRDSYFPYQGSQSQSSQPQVMQHAAPSSVQQPQAPPALEPPLDSPAGHPTLFQNTNLLTPEDRAYITAFLEGVPVIRPNATDTLYQIVMNQEQVTDPVTGKTMYELILIEMNFETGEWRKIKRKRNKPHVPPEQQQQPPPPSNQHGFNAHQPIVL
ncbi:hypothetical protein BGZ73_004751 [Actinomortierella ambigua]|nr:hypothetical protein BGZ73_004751 [Actinomortierella ambigua]